MPQSPPSGQNQTLLELIYAIKGLAQTVEFYHQDLLRQLEEAAKDRQKELDRIRDAVAKNGQSLAVLPITLSDRVEKLIDRLEDSVDDKLDDGWAEIKSGLVEVRNRLLEYGKAISSDSNGIVVESESPEREDVTGKIEVTEAGELRMAFSSGALKKIKYIIISLSTIGGGYGLWEVIKALFS